MLQSIFFTVKIMVGACNALIPTYTAHHYPVYMRNLGIGAGNLAAGFALVLVPYLFLLVSKKIINFHPFAVLLSYNIKSN